MNDQPVTSEKNSGYPPGIPYIVGNEAAERFSFYGMRAILYVYMAALYQTVANPLPEADAKVAALQVVHLFNSGVYAFTLIGAVLADRLLGKYHTIFWVSLIYCAGHGMLAVAGESLWGMYTGLALVAVASGGIKPCVGANVGDQFTSANAHLITKIYQIFYFSINFGSFFSTLLIPWLYKEHGPQVAFAVPGVLMGLATLFFWLGRDRFVKAPPNPGGKLGFLDFLASVFLFVPLALFLFFKDLNLLAMIGLSVISLAIWLVLFLVRQRIREDSGFVSVLLYSLRKQRLRRPGMGFFDVAREKFGDEAAEGPPAVLRIMLVFSMVSVFWALFDQHSSTWIEQAGQMDLRVGRLELTASMVPALNPLFVMLIIPLLNFAVYVPLEKRGMVIKPLSRMTAGMFIAASSFVAAALVQAGIESAPPSSLPVEWQLLQYILLTVAEVLVSITGLEFAYTQAPRAMKSTIVGFWYLCVAMGNKLVDLLAPLLQKLSLSRFFWLFAGLMLLAAVLFAVLAHFYRGKTYLQDAAR